MFIIIDDVPTEVVIALPITLSIFLVISKFTWAPALSWSLCLFPIWGSALLVVVSFIAVIIAMVIKSVWESIFW